MNYKLRIKFGFVIILFLALLGGKKLSEYEKSYTSKRLPTSIVKVVKTCNPWCKNIN